MYGNTVTTPEGKRMDAMHLAPGHSAMGGWSEPSSSTSSSQLVYGGQMLPKVLVVEDSVEFQAMIRATLGKNIQVTMASTLSEARAAARSQQFDLFLLDVMLPDGSGFDFCSELQADTKTQSTPVIFLTGKTGVTDKVLGLTLGADDYMTKPFEPAELRARVESKLKKALSQKQDENILHRGWVRLEVPTYTAFLLTEQGERKLDLTPIEYKLLYRLAQHPGHILTRQQLIDLVWGQNTFLEERSVDKHVSSLRKKLDMFGKKIRTVSGLGYQFVPGNE